MFSTGTFEIECETNSHYINGMTASFTVSDSTDRMTSSEEDDETRIYYIGVVEKYWDYAPVKWDPVRSENLTDPDR